MVDIYFNCEITFIVSYFSIFYHKKLYSQMFKFLSHYSHSVGHHSIKFFGVTWFDSQTHRALVTAIQYVYMVCASNAQI